MSVDFFDTNCKEPARSDGLFGLCDDQNGTKAYTNVDNRDKWIAIVKNDNNIDITFTPIDNCIVVLKDDSKDKESTCNGMLIFQDKLYLVELKKQGTGGWIPDAIGQLTNTIIILLANSDLKEFKYKKAFACNKKRPYFQRVDTEINLKLFRTYGFRIDIQAKILIK